MSIPLRTTDPHQPRLLIVVFVGGLIDIACALVVVPYGLALLKLRTEIKSYSVTKTTDGVFASLTIN